MTHNATTTRSVFLLVLILIGGLFLRFHQIGAESYWVDEAYSLHHGQADSFAQLVSWVAQTEAAPIGYYTLIWGWISLFGTPEIAVRTLSALFSFFSLILFYLLVRKFFSGKMALLATLFMATSMLQVVYAQEARLYAMFGFLVLLSAYLLSILIDEHSLGSSSRKWWFYAFVYSLVMILMIYTHYFSLFVLLFYFVYLYFAGMNRKFWQKWVTVHILIFIAAIPLLSLFLTQFNLVHQGYAAILIAKGIPLLLARMGFFILAVPLLIVLFLLIIFLKYHSQIRIRTEKLLQSNFLLLCIFSIAGLFYLYLIWRPFTPFGIPLIGVPITHSFSLIRYTIFLYPLFYVFLAWVINLKANKKLSSILIAGIMLINIIALSAYFSQEVKDPWREAMEIVDQRDGEIILLDKGSLSHQYLIEHYSNRDMEMIWLTKSGDGRVLEEKDLEEIPLLVEEQTFWLILARNERTTTDYENYLNRNYDLLYAVNLGNITLHQYGNI